MTFGVYWQLSTHNTTQSYSNRMNGCESFMSLLLGLHWYGSVRNNISAKKCEQKEN